MAFMIAASDWIISIVLGDQWMGVSPIFVCLAASAPALVVCDTTGWLFVTQARTNDMLKWTAIGVPLTVVGILVGIGATLSARSVLGTQLYGISPTDVQTYALVAAGVLIAAALACVIPAVRALRVSPLVALRDL